jgi:hypothetical protein
MQTNWQLAAVRIHPFCVEEEEEKEEEEAAPLK